jgi:hypothetical protein
MLSGGVVDRVFSSRLVFSLMFFLRRRRLNYLTIADSHGKNITYLGIDVIT